MNFLISLVLLVIVALLVIIVLLLVIGMHPTHGTTSAPRPRRELARQPRQVSLTSGWDADDWDADAWDDASVAPSTPLVPIHRQLRSAEPEPGMWALDPIFESQPADRGLAVPLERLLALMLTGSKLERRPYSYDLDEWLLRPIDPEAEGEVMQVRVADAERAARHPDVTDASHAFGQPIGTSYLHRDALPLLLIVARLRAATTEERRRIEWEGGA